ncbi:2-dehydro-3-deoxyglucarate aldolase [Pseudomonas sp. R1-43-08]|uniref:HpcH/HpaI aldolase family protein n=1 Tax=Pseudomonas sp. R1-43-08 TaxID=1173270 RepID=UPI000F6E0D6D|nr:aldolase/citrate lyase family protein [Pseudomonas sp. R1-43-08]AZF42570.1 2-dehydro-3-deoxyglucarate aldolase [Pseudomonas sp. R1-43-08]
MRFVNPIKHSLKSAKSTVGCWLTLASPAVAELIAHCGFDWLVIDAEHGPSDTQDIAAQLRAIDAAAFNGARAVGAVRVTANDPSMVKRAMDCGAQTIIFPNINTAADAKAAVASMLFPLPDQPGIRGVAGMVRAGSYGLDSDYVKSANSQACAIVLIESVEGVKNVDAIAEVEGVDCLFIGTADLSASMGYLGQTGHADVKAAVEKVLAAARKQSKAVGIFATSVEEARQYREKGVTFIALHSDTGWLTKGATDALDALNLEK